MEATAVSTIDAPRPYDFATPEFTLIFPVVWPNKEGRITVTHKLRRPTLEEMTEWKKRTVIERQYDKRGEMKSETAETFMADVWLWNRIALAFSGYPGMEGLIDVTPEYREQMQTTHKERAIDYLLEADAEIVDGEATGLVAGEWNVLLRIGPNQDEPIGKVKFRLRQWTERERRDFEKKASISSNKTEGKTTTSRHAVNLKAFGELFDSLLIDVEDGVVDGRTFAEIGREAFAREINGEFKVQILTELTRRWRSSLSD